MAAAECVNGRRFPETTREAHNGGGAIIQGRESTAMAQFAVILPAAGKSSRFHDKNYKKPFAPLCGRAVWLHVAERLLNHDDVKQTILIISHDDREYFDFKLAGNAAILGVEVVEGGQERADSVERALARVKNDIDFIDVHDAARPCIVDE